MSPNAWTWIACRSAPQRIGLKIEIRRVFEQNFRVYGVRKVWGQLKREGFDVARCSIAMLMRSMSLQGIIRGKPIRTTFSDKTAPSLLDRVNRQFKAPVPNRLGYKLHLRRHMAGFCLRGHVTNAVHLRGCHQRLC